MKLDPLDRPRSVAMVEVPKSPAPEITLLLVGDILLAVGLFFSGTK